MEVDPHASMPVQAQHAEDVREFTLHMMLFDYSVMGEIAEPDALLAECPDSPPSTHLWDLTLADLQYQAIDRGRGWEAPPYWYCLRHLPWGWREHAYGELINDGPEDMR